MLLKRSQLNRYLNTIGKKKSIHYSKIRVYLSGMRWLKLIFFSTSNVWSKHQTLQSSTWKQLFQTSPGLSVIRKERNKLTRLRAQNSFLGAFAIISLMCLSLVGMCYMPATTITKYFSWVQWFNFKSDEQAYATISEVMGSTATIIGLSFVVIGFLFDKVKAKTQKTLEELFRATGLYHVFGISVITIVSLVILNCFKYTAESYVVRNFAVLSSLFLVSNALAIAFMFYRLLQFFNPERVAEIASQQILEMAKFRLLDDRYSQTSSMVYVERLASYGFEEKNRFSMLLNRDQAQPIWLELGNKKEVHLLNVYFPFLKLLVGRFSKLSQETGFVEMGIGSRLSANQAILSLSNDVKIGFLERCLFEVSYLTTKTTTNVDDFDLMKEQLEKRFLKSSADGDEDGISQSLDDIEKLYDIYYQSIS